MEPHAVVKDLDVRGRARFWLRHVSSTPAQSMSAVFIVAQKPSILALSQPLPARLMRATTPWERRRSRYASPACRRPRSEWWSNPGAGRCAATARSKARATGAVGMASSAAQPTIRRLHASSTPATQSQPSLVATPVRSAGHTSPGCAGGSARSAKRLGALLGHRWRPSVARGRKRRFCRARRPGAAHEPRDPAATTRFPHAAERHRQSGTAVGAPARLEKLARLAAQPHVLAGT